MSLVCLASAHGSPGVTTTTLVLASVWPGDGRRLAVEADVFGGVVAARFGLADTPGLVSLAAEAGDGVDWEGVGRHAQPLPGGLPVLVAPPSVDPSSAVIRDLAPRLADWAASEDVVVVVDCGRLVANRVQQPVLAQADRVLVVCRPMVDQLRPAANLIRRLAEGGVDAELLLVGDMPYGPREVAETMGVDVVGTVAWDPHTAAAVNGFRGSARGHDRSVLVRSITTLATRLTHPSSPDPVGVGA